MRMCSLLCHLLLATLLFSPGAHATDADNKELQWLGGDLPPFIWEDNGTAQGYGAELINAMAEKLGRKPDIAFYPWARAVKTAQESSNYAVLPLLRSPDREANFKWLILLERVKYSFFARRTDNKGKNAMPAFLLSLDQLRDKRIGVLRGSPIIRRLQAENFTHIVEETSYTDLLRQLNLGGLDAVYAGYPMLSSVIRQSDYPAERFVAGTSLGDGDLYIGTSLTLDPGEADAWSKAYATLQRNGTVARLRNKYGLSKLN